MYMNTCGTHVFFIALADLTNMPINKKTWGEMENVGQHFISMLMDYDSLKMSCLTLQGSLISSAYAVQKGPAGRSKSSLHLWSTCYAGKFSKWVFLTVVLQDTDLERKLKITNRLQCHKVCFSSSLRMKKISDKVQKVDRCQLCMEILWTRMSMPAFIQKEPPWCFHNMVSGSHVLQGSSDLLSDLDCYSGYSGWA